MKCDLEDTNGMIRVSQTIYAKYTKRIFDVLFSLLLLVFLFPILITISLLVLIDVGRPILFKTYRPGKNGQLFELYKFHDLNNKTDDEGNLLPPNERVTKIGYWLRRTSLDELPQLLNILKGDMSFIGPRPLLKEYLNYYTPRQNMRHAIRPGLECPPIIDRDHPRSWEEQFEDDIWYVEHVSFTVDCKMFFKLVKLVFNRRENARRAETNRGYFGGISQEEKNRINQGYKQSLK